jgi:hypothetical protein
MSEIAQDLRERVGLLRDKADNFCHATMLPLPAHIHVQALSGGMADIRAELDAIYKALGGTE